MKTLTAILTLAIFTITDATQDPAILRLILSMASAVMIASVYLALASEQTITTTTVLLSTAFTVGTWIDTDPTIHQVLLAFIACPIISVIAIKQGIKREDQALVESKKATKNDRS